MCTFNFKIFKYIIIGENYVDFPGWFDLYRYLEGQIANSNDDRKPLTS